MCASVCERTRVRARVCVHARVCVCLCLCMCMCVCVPASIFVCVHMYFTDCTSYMHIRRRAYNSRMKKDLSSVQSFKT